VVETDKSVADEACGSRDIHQLTRSSPEIVEIHHLKEELNRLEELFPIIAPIFKMSRNNSRQVPTKNQPQHLLTWKFC
jgi:hypothetical protein